MRLGHVVKQQRQTFALTGQFENDVGILRAGRNVARIAAAGSPTGVRLIDVTPFTSEWTWSLGAQYEVGINDTNTITPRFDIASQTGFYAPRVMTPRVSCLRTQSRKRF